MEWYVMSCVVLAMMLSTQVEAAIFVPRDNRSQSPEPAAVLNSGRPEGALLLLKDAMDQGDTLLKEQLKQSYTNLKELLKEGDAVLKEQISEGVAQMKEQRKEGDERLKEELDEDVTWLKDKLAKGQTRMKEDLAEEEAKMKEELADLKGILELLKNSVKRTMSSDSWPDDLRQQMSDLQTELTSSRLQLKVSQEILQSLQADLQITQADLQTTQADLQTTQADLQTTQADFLNAKEDTGSVFTRWGCARCPDNASLVYSGVMGGSWYDHKGGASNYLCLGMTPELDNGTARDYRNFLYGVEYGLIVGKTDQDVVCAVCRVPQSTILMVPATLTCPPGWTPQYRGHLASGHYNHPGRTEYVCLDALRERRDGGQANDNGGVIYEVYTRCGSLPCPPYEHDKRVTCVVCSM